MNAQNAAQLLPLVQALADGKLEFKSIRGWELVAYGQNIDFTQSIDGYRIKPKPREWDMWITPKGELTTNSDMLTREQIRVREILEP